MLLLRSEARLDSTPFRIIEVPELAVDEELPAGTFDVELPRGNTFQDVGASPARPPRGGHWLRRLVR